MIFILKTIEDNSICLYDLELSYQDKIELKEIKKGDKISLLSDNMFKTMFLNDSRLKYSAKFISYYIDVDYELLLKRMKLVKTHFNKKKANEINRSGDYVANLKGNYIAIEVNNNGSMSILERNMEYSHRLFASQIRRNSKNNKKNKKKEKKYSQVILININNFSFKGNNKIVDTFYMKNEDSIILSKKMIIIQIYIPNLIRKWYNCGIQNLTESERYLLTLVLQDNKKLNEVGGNEFMKEYIKDATEASEEEELLISYDKEKALYELGNSEGYKRGEKLGYAKGEKLGYAKGEKFGYAKGEKFGYVKGEQSGYSKGIYKVAKNLLMSNMKKEEVSMYTGLTMKELDMMK